MKVLMDPRTVRKAAGTCRHLAGDIDDLAGQVAGLPHPEGMPADAASALASIRGALGRSSRAVRGQAVWLDYRATAGMFADGPFGTGLLDYTGPPLLSPWDMPTPPAHKKQKKSRWDRIWDNYEKAQAAQRDFKVGVAEGLWNLGKGAAQTAVVGGAHFIDSRTGMPVSDRIPWVGDMRRDFDAGVAWAAKHPKEFAELMGQDLIAADEDNEAKRAGRITVEIGSFFVPASKLAKLGKLAKAGKVPHPAKASAGTATGAPQGLRPPANNPLSPQKQAGHISGTPQHLQRVKAGKPTSTFSRGDQAEELTRQAWSNGTPVPGRPGVRDFDFGFPVGHGPGGGLQSRVRVHIDGQGRIHGHPAGPEMVP